LQFNRSVCQFRQAVRIILARFTNNLTFGGFVDSVTIDSPIDSRIDQEKLSARKKSLKKVAQLCAIKAKTMRFEREWMILTLTAILQIGCASADKIAKVSSSHRLDSHAGSAESLSTAASSEPQTILNSPTSIDVDPNVAIADVPPVHLASATIAVPSAIVVTAQAPPMIGENKTVESRSMPEGSAVIQQSPVSDGQKGAQESDTASTQPLNPSSEDNSVPTTPETPIHLETALELAAGQNPQVAYANERIRESFAKLETARVLWLPSLRAGANYHKHEGRIQDVAGTIIETSRNSVYNGIGAQAVGAGSPAVPGVLMNFHLKDSVFQPRIAEQIVGANRHASRAVANDILLETAIAYVDLLEASQLRAIVNDTLVNTERLAALTAQYAMVGEGLQSDADRAATELALRKFEAQKSIEQTKIQSVRLARLLSQDPSLFLTPAEPMLAPIELVATNSDMASLVAQGLSTRPELTEHQYLVGEAIERLRREQVAPLIPSVLLGLSYGGNGGGLGSSFQNYGDRMDFDAAAFWEVRNLGYGEHSARCEAQSRIRQARYRQVQMLDQVAGEIVEAKTQLDAKQAQIELAQSAILTARESYRRNSERIAAGQGLPIEVQQSIQALDHTQRLYASTIADYNRAQFRLHRALGFPVMQ
jgi:outer membrane protein TolC